MAKRSGSSMTGRRWLAVPSVVLGAAAVICGLALALLVGHGAHLRPTYRGELWNDLWAARLARPTALLAALALASAWLAAWRVPASRVARAGRLLAIVGLLLSLGPWAVRVGQWLGNTRPSIQCLSNVKNLALAINMYVTDYSHLPPSDRWADVTHEYLQTQDRWGYRCPQASGTFGYAYNDALGDLAADALADPARVPAIFEANAGWNAHGGKELLPPFARHMGGENLGFADGHAAWYARQKPRGEVRWNTVWPRGYHKSGIQWRPARKRQAR